MSNNGPTPPFNNPPIQPYFFKPRSYFIENITLGQTTIVTTTIDHDYVIGQECRLLIYPSNGCRELNEVTGIVIIIPSQTQVTLNIDSSVNVNPFVLSTVPTQPQIIAIGNINTGSINSNGPNFTLPYIPGSFRNISPFPGDIE